MYMYMYANANTMYVHVRVAMMCVSMELIKLKELKHLFAMVFCLQIL